MCMCSMYIHDCAYICLCVSRCLCCICEIYACVYTYVCVCSVYICIYVYGESEVYIQCLSQSLSTLIFDTFLSGSGPTDAAGLTSQQAPGILPSLHHQCCHCRHMDSYKGAGD